MKAIYLDHAATTPIHPQVALAMQTVLTDQFGNPSSIHQHGRAARKIVDEARREMAKSIGANETNIIFTSGGTEANNMAIIGTALKNKARGRHIITTAIEHHAVLHPCQYLMKNGFDVTILPVDQSGKIAVSDVEAALREDTILVSVMYANNETGTRQPIAEIGKLLKGTGAAFHTDAVQAYAVTSIDVNELGIDLLSVTAHKMSGPKGSGFLYVRDGVELSPLFFGGEQERKRRAGTENVAGIIGFKTAIEVAKEKQREKIETYKRLRQRLLEQFEESGIDYVVNGDVDECLPHILNVSFPGTTAEALLVNLDLAGISASSGSACTAGSLEPSHVLTAMFPHDKKRAESAIRFSFGLGNTVQEIEKAGMETLKAVERMTGR